MYENCPYHLRDLTWVSFDVLTPLDSEVSFAFTPICLFIFVFPSICICIYYIDCFLPARGPWWRNIFIPSNSEIWWNIKIIHLSLSLYLYYRICKVCYEFELRQQIRVSDALMSIVFSALYVADNNLGAEILALSLFSGGCAFRCAYIIGLGSNLMIRSYKYTLIDYKWFNL